MSIVLDWTHVDNDRTFHDLVNAWLLSELNYAAFDPGDPRGGADRGWDGLFHGTLPFAPEYDPGLWMCQAKHTKHSKAEACRHLLRELKGSTKRKGEIEKARAAGADYLLLITSASLEPDHAKSLRDANDGRLKGIVVFHRTKLEHLFRQRPWVCREFFGVPSEPALVPEWMFSPGLASLPVVQLPFVGRDKVVASLGEVVASSSCVLVTGALGVGKTRLVRQCAANAHALFPALTVLFYNGMRPACDVIQDELPDGTDYLLVLDDAGRDYDATTRPFVKLAQQRNGTLRLILTVTDANKPLLQRQLAADGGLETREVAVPALNEEVMARLVRDNLPGLDSDDVERVLRAACGNPLWLGLAVPAIQQEGVVGAVLSEGALRRRLVARSMEAGARVLGTACGAPQDFLAALAGLVPVRDPAEMEAPKQLRELVEEGTLSACLDALVNVGVLRRVGATFRFSPDLLGDMILAERLAALDGPLFRRKIVEPTVEDAPERVMGNLLQASHDLAVSDLVSDVVRSWRAQEQQEPTPNRQERLKACRLAAMTRPQDVLDFVEAVLTSPVAEDRLSDRLSPVEVYEAACRGEPIFRPLTTDHVGGPLMVAGHDAEVTGRAMRLLPLLEGVRQGTFDSYRAERLMRRWHSPTSVGPATVAAALEEDSRWLDGGDEGKARLALEGAATVLQVSWLYHRASPHGFRVGTWVAPASKTVLSLRESAVGIVRKALGHPAPSVRIAGIAAVEAIGREGGVVYDANEEPLAQTAKEERRSLYRVLCGQVRAESHLGVLNAAASLWLNAWLQQQACADEALQGLGVLQWSPLLSAFRWAHEPQNGVDDLRTLIRDAPSKGRWRWWTEGWRSREDNGEIDRMIAHHEPLVKALADINPGPEGFVALLGRLAEDGCSPKRPPPWFWSYQHQHPEAFEALQAKAFDGAPALFREHVRQVWAWRTPNSFCRCRQLMPDISAADAAEVRWFLRVAEVAKDRPTGKELEELYVEAARHSDPVVRRDVVDRAKFLRGIDTQGRINVVSAALAHGYDTQIVREANSLIAHQVRGPVDLRGMRAVMPAVVASAPDHPGRELGALVARTAEADVPRYLVLLDHALRACAGAQSSWALRPSRLWRDPPPLVSSAADVALFIEQVSRWHDECVLKDVEEIYWLQGIGDCFPDVTVSYVCGLAEVGEEQVRVAEQLLDEVPFALAQNAWLHLLEVVADDAPAWPSVAKAFARAASWVPHFSSTGGQDPPQLRKRATLLDEMLARERDPRRTALLRRARESIGARLVRFRQEMEEEADPR